MPDGQFGAILITMDEYHELQRLRAENAAVQEIIEAVAAATGWYDSDGPTVCMFCTKSEDRYSKDWELEHTSDCPVTKARALLATKTAR